MAHGLTTAGGAVRITGVTEHPLEDALLRLDVGCPDHLRPFLGIFSEPHCGLMPASRMTFPHFAVSVLNCAAHSSGVLPTGSKPSVAIRSFMPGSAIALAISRWSSATISLGVRAGTTAMVGTSGSACDRILLVTASARSLPSLNDPTV